MAPTRVHLDTDLGGDIDDLCALALLLTWPDVAITGITTVLEHQGKRAGYARYALALAGRNEVPVAAGAEVGLGCFRLQDYGFPPEERYWPEPVTPAPGPLEAALDLLKQSIELGAIVVAIGPFTNLVLLERRSPGVLRHATLCLMGGSITPAPPGFPAWDYEMDFNVQADPSAAKQVLESADPDRTTLVPIEVTAQTALRRAYLPALRRAGPLGQLVARQAEACAQDWSNEERYGRTCEGLPRDIINFQHDPLACAVALGWSGVTVESLPLALALEVVWLRMRIDGCGRRLRVVTRVDQARFNAFWLDTVTRRPTAPQ
ncbi:MAG: nucleoside hydrolase [Chloroflexi bacterium]|nr:nucleoside hydrolase [Chloroflexota bacterium]